MGNPRPARVAGLTHFLPLERPREMAERAIAFLLDGGRPRAREGAAGRRRPRPPVADV
jgi:hypothetical protein